MHVSDKFTEEEIVERILTGETSLYEIIVRRYNPYLYKIGRSYNYNHEDTQDLMQETYVDAYKNLSQFEGRSNFKTWIVRIMMNNCYRKQQKSSYKNEMNMEEVNDKDTPMFSGGSPRTDKVVHNRELGRIIEESLQNIPESYRIVFSLRTINGLSVAETAELLDISETNVKVRLNRAKNMLKLELEKEYDEMELFEFNLIYCDAMVDRVMNEIKKL